MDLRTAVVTRRAVLHGSAILASVVTTRGFQAVAPGRERGPVSTTSPAAGVARERVETLEGRAFDSAWNHELLVDFPAVYMPPELAGWARVSLSWDSRLFDLQTIYLTSDSGTVEAFLSSSAAGELSFELPASTRSILFRAEVQDLYPADNVADVIPSSLKLISEDGQVIEQATLQVSSQPCAPWGVEAAVNWICLDGRVVPAVVGLTSVGPHPVPAGATLEMTVPDTSSTTPALRWASATAGEEPSEKVPVSVESTAAGLMRSIRATTTSELNSGEQILLEFSREASNSRPDAFGAQVPRVVFVAPDGSAGMRQTGRLESFPVTDSGNQASSYKAAPTA